MRRGTPRATLTHFFNLIVISSYVLAMLVDAVTYCHACIDASSNEECNVNVGMCMFPETDVCFTEVFRTELTGNRYTKVCEKPFSSFDAHHEKTDLKVFVVVIPKEGLAGWGPFFGYNTYYCTRKYNL